MRSVYTLPAVGFFITLSLNAQTVTPGRDRVPVIGTSGDVEIASLLVTRQKVSDAAKEADLVYMEVDLWLTRKHQRSSGHFQIKLLELDRIVDDTDTLLSTKKRRDKMELLKYEKRVSHTKTSRGKEGPFITIRLDAPARQATRILRLKGKVAIAELATPTAIRFANLATLNGKQLKHPELKDFPVRVTVNVNNGSTSVYLRVPADHARLFDWGVENAELESETGSKADGTFQMERVYQGDHSTGSLYLLISPATNPRVLDFDFRDIDLP